jgi:hypothetical protein
MNKNLLAYSSKAPAGLAILIPRWHLEECILLGWGGGKRLLCLYMVKDRMVKRERTRREQTHAFITALISPMRTDSFWPNRTLKLLSFNTFITTIKFQNEFWRRHSNSRLPNLCSYHIQIHPFCSISPKVLTHSSSNSKAQKPVPYMEANSLPAVSLWNQSKEEKTVICFQNIITE